MSGWDSGCQNGVWALPGVPEVTPEDPQYVSVVIQLSESIQVFFNILCFYFDFNHPKTLLTRFMWFVFSFSLSNCNQTRIYRLKT